MININPATENITGYQKEELLNQTFFHFIVAPDQKKTLHHFEKSVKGGLMVSHKIIEAHQGSLKIKSQIDKGTTVELILPILNPD